MAFLVTLIPVVEFYIAGIPVPQGSKTARVLRTPSGVPRASVYDDNDKVLKPWRKRVMEAAIAARGETPTALGAIRVDVEFRFVKPKSVRRLLPSVRPDVDKLQRSLFDGMTVAAVWKDDAQIVTVNAEKRYADEPGVHVRVWEYHPTPKEGMK
jgi:Holliday junction resolvase RusA-like endonuclease